MALQKLQNELSARFSTDSTATEILEYISKYVTDEQAQYSELRSSNKITFGKHRGRLVSELCDTQEGLQYLAWALDQEWCKAPYHSDFIEQCNLKGLVPGLSVKYGKQKNRKAPY